MQKWTRPCAGRGRPCHRRRAAARQISVQEAEPGQREGRSGRGEIRNSNERARRSDRTKSAMRAGRKASPCHRGDTVSLTKRRWWESMGASFISKQDGSASSRRADAKERLLFPIGVATP